MMPLHSAIARLRRFTPLGIDRHFIWVAVYCSDRTSDPTTNAPPE
jgi:hypothetical protein